MPFWHPSLRLLLHRAQDFVALVAASGAAEAAVYEPDPIWDSEAVAKDTGVGDDCPFDCAGGILSFFVVAAPSLSLYVSNSSRSMRPESSVSTCLIARPCLREGTLQCP